MSYLHTAAMVLNASERKASRARARVLHTGIVCRIQIAISNKSRLTFLPISRQAKLAAIYGIACDCKRCTDPAQSPTRPTGTVSTW